MMKAVRHDFILVVSNIFLERDLIPMKKSDQTTKYICCQGEENRKTKEMMWLKGDLYVLKENFLAFSGGNYSNIFGFSLQKYGLQQCHKWTGYMIPENNVSVPIL